METVKNEPGKKKFPIMIIAGLLLILSVSLYFVYTGYYKNVDLTEEKNLLSVSFKNLSDTLDIRKTEIEQISNRNTELDSTVAASQVIIENEKKQITSLLSKSKLSKAELVEVKARIADYKILIAELQNKMVELSAQNEILKQDNQKLGTDLDSERKNTAQLNEQNIVLSKKVEIGSLLQLAKVDVEAVKQKNNGKDKVVKNAKAAESIRIGFETGSNKILAKGPLSLYIRIINPKGETISVANQGSGILQLAESNTQVQYSKKADIDWNQTGKKVDVYWTQNIASSGTYKVEIYQSGYLIGKGQTVLN
jgi:cell division protein FtsB